MGFVAFGSVVAPLLILACGQPPAVVAPPPAPSVSVRPPPPPPPERVRRALVTEAIDAARAEVRWEQDFRRASLTLTYDVVLAQEQALCPAPALAPDIAVVDALGCPGISAFSPECAEATTVRARTPVTVSRTLAIELRCLGDVEPYPLPATGDVRASLSAHASDCFLRHNKFHPRASWASLYALTELRIQSSPPTVSGELVGAVARTIDLASHDESSHLAAPSPRFCRDDVAYLDGVVPALSATRDEPPIASALALAEALDRAAPMSIAPVAPKSLGAADVPTWSVPLTGDTFKSEHALWEACAAPEVKSQLVVQQRCLLLRQIDRLLRDVEDQVRPRTPTGTLTTPSPSASTSASIGAPR